MGNKLSEYRKRKNMTQEELSIKSGVSRKTISDLEGSVEKYHQ
jgi:DNA-binding XRE family transcriptional regulator